MKAITLTRLNGGKMTFLSDLLQIAEDREGGTFIQWLSGETKWNTWVKENPEQIAKLINK